MLSKLNKSMPSLQTTYASLYTEQWLAQCQQSNAQEFYKRDNTIAKVLPEAEQ